MSKILFLILGFLSFVCICVLLMLFAGMCKLIGSSIRTFVNVLRGE